MLLLLEVHSGISIHAPQTRCDALTWPYHLVFQFQSTHLKRGATWNQFSPSWPQNFNPRTSNEVRLCLLNWRPKIYISIHAPQTRCDGISKVGRTFTQISIHAPQTRCDPDKVSRHTLSRISIHAPQTRCDQHARHLAPMHGHFNPRTSNEVRLPIIIAVI